MKETETKRDRERAERLLIDQIMYSFEQIDYSSEQFPNVSEQIPNSSEQNIYSNIYLFVQNK